MVHLFFQHVYNCKSRKRAILASSEEEEREFISTHVIVRRKLIVRNLKLEETRIRFERDREERLNSRMQRNQDHKVKILRIEEGRKGLE